MAELRTAQADNAKRIAELENAYNLLQSHFDITRERWMKRGEHIAKQRECIAELESLVRDMYRKLDRCHRGDESGISWAAEFDERMKALGLEVDA